MKYLKVFEIFMTNFIMAGSILCLNPMDCLQSKIYSF